MFRPTLRPYLRELGSASPEEGCPVMQVGHRGGVVPLQFPTAATFLSALSNVLEAD